jgi:hypothetical protein
MMGVNRERGESLVRNVLLFCVLRDDVFEDSWGENRHRGVLEKAEKYFLKLTSLVFVLAEREREREREREMNARQRERERERKRET